MSEELEEMETNSTISHDIEVKEIIIPESPAPSIFLIIFF